MLLGWNSEVRGRNEIVALASWSTKAEFYARNSADGTNDGEPYEWVLYTGQLSTIKSHASHLAN